MFGPNANFAYYYKRLRREAGFDFIPRMLSGLAKFVLGANDDDDDDDINLRLRDLPKGIRTC